MKFLTKIKPQYLIIFLIFLLVPVLILLGRNFNIPSTAVPTPTPQASFASPTIEVPNNISAARVLQIIRAAPPESPNITYSYIQPIELTFNNQVRAANLKYSVNPPTEIELKNGKYPNIITISPITKWIDGKTTITILSGSHAEDGSILYAPFVYEINTLRPTDPPHSGEDY